MRALEELILKVKAGRLKPDATRSGRWVACEPDALSDPETEYKADTSEDAESSNTSTEQEGVDERKAAKVLGDEVKYPEMPAGGIWPTAGRSTLHRGFGPEDAKTACGFVLKTGVSKWSEEWPAEDRPLCRRSHCFP